jgi:hypothetical protein
MFTGLITGFKNALNGVHVELGGPEEALLDGVLDQFDSHDKEENEEEDENDENAEHLDSPDDGGEDSIDFDEKVSTWIYCKQSRVVTLS